MADGTGALPLDGNEAVARVAYRLSEVVAIYPITPSSSMGELSEEWSAQGKTNLWGDIPSVMEMQSEGGAAGTVHGAAQAGALATTFTASQGLLLMIPNMYKLAGELTPFVMHVAARTLATHALSIFGDHSDIMACRQTGFAMLCGSNVQEAQDLAAVAHAATLRTRIPFMHVMDGFRTSHELNMVTPLADETLRALVHEADVVAHRQRALNPDHPVLRGTAANPDTFFQAREAANPFYTHVPAAVASVMDTFQHLTGRRYRLFQYDGHPEARDVLVIMGSGAETVRETVRHLVAQGQRVGCVTVRLYRPFSLQDFVDALPPSVQRISVLDRTKEPGAPGEPLYLDVVATLAQAQAQGRLDQMPRVVGGRYGLSSKEFTPAMVRAVLNNLESPTPRHGFTVGINDDVTHLSLPVDNTFHLPQPGTLGAIFHGLGSDGTVGSNKQSMKILSDGGDRHAQAYFVYDSKKSGSVTVSHLRFGSQPIHAPYLVEEANFVGIHQPQFVDQRSLLEQAAPGATVLLNAPWSPDRVWEMLPQEFQQDVLHKKLKLFVVDADGLSLSQGLPGRVGTVLQACFFALTNVLPVEEALRRVKESVAKSFEKKGTDVVRKNVTLVDLAVAALREVVIPPRVTSTRLLRPPVPPQAPDLIQRVTALMLAGHGDQLPVSAFPVDGTWPTATSQWEKRNIARDIPVWDPSLCIQCNKCVSICPHAVIRAKVVPEATLAAAPEGFQTLAWKGHGFEGQRYTLQVSSEDCTGCRLCAEVCPAKDKAAPRRKALMMAPVADAGPTATTHNNFFLTLPEVDRTQVGHDLKGSQLLRPLFEYSGACAGCGETPYIKLLTQLFGDRLLIANATGCSSIYGGNLPTTPYCVDEHGRGPAWANSLFEDNAEFGLGMRLGVDAQQHQAQRLLQALATRLPAALVEELLAANQGDEAGIQAQRARVEALQRQLSTLDGPDVKRLQQLAGHLVKRSVWLVGGDGWAYDIGFGGLDHVMSTGTKVNILVLDTEVYSNTGGQQSKATPRGASARFAAHGKAAGKKDLGLMAMAYGNVYVAQVALGAKDAQTVKAFHEAEAHPGPSLIIAYSHCIAHGYDLVAGPSQQKLAVSSGVWPLYRYDPARVERGEPGLVLDSDGPKTRVEEYMRQEGRFRMAQKADPTRFARLLEETQRAVHQRHARYTQLTQPTPNPNPPRQG